MGDNLLSTSDMAKALGVSESRVGEIARLREIGQLVGRTRVFTPEDVDKMKPGDPGRPRNEAKERANG